MSSFSLGCSATDNLIFVITPNSLPPNLPLGTRLVCQFNALVISLEYTDLWKAGIS